jgi:uncharacterized membrane protein YeiH
MLGETPVLERAFDPALLLVLNLIGTFVFALTGAMAAVRERLDVFGVLVLAAVVGLAGGVVRDLLIGTPPAAVRDWEFLLAAGTAGLVVLFAFRGLERFARPIAVLDAAGLAVFCVAGAAKALDFGLSAGAAVLLGAITGIGGGMVRDLIVGETPHVLRGGLYAVPALLGAAIVVAAERSGTTGALFPILGALSCFVVRMLGIRYDLSVPVGPIDVSVRRRRREDL